MPLDRWTIRLTIFSAATAATFPSRLYRPLQDVSSICGGILVGRGCKQAAQKLSGHIASEAVRCMNQCHLHFYVACALSWFSFLRATACIRSVQATNKHEAEFDEVSEGGRRGVQA
jgi:hypothetical protein